MYGGGNRIYVLLSADRRSSSGLPNPGPARLLVRAPYNSPTQTTPYMWQNRFESRLDNQRASDTGCYKTAGPFVTVGNP